MTKEQRLVKLENQASEMRIVSSGPGTVLFGVPEYRRKGSDFDQRLTNLDKWSTELKLVGKDLRVAGSFENGFSVNGQT